MDIVFQQVLNGLTLGGIYSLEFELEVEPDQDRIRGTLAFYCAPERTEELTRAALGVLAHGDHIR